MNQDYDPLLQNIPQALRKEVTLKQVDISQFNLETERKTQNAIPPLEDGSYKGFIERVEVHREEKPEQYRNSDTDTHKSVIRITTVFPLLEKVLVDSELTERRMVYFATVAFGKQSNLYQAVLSKFADPVSNLLLLSEDGQRVMMLPDEPLKLGSLVLVSNETGYELIGCPVQVMTEVATKKNGEPYNKVIHIKPREGSYLDERTWSSFG
jgi:hypothetical protein